MSNRLKNWAITQSLDHPKRTVIICILVTLLFASGIKYFHIEDDLMKILPKTMETVQTWETIKDEFGSTEIMFVAFGKRGESVYNPTTMAKLWDVTEAIESIPEVDEVMAISTSNRMSSIDGFLEVSDLQPKRDLTEEEILSIQEYLQDNETIAKRFINQEQDFLNMIIKPVIGSEPDILSKSVTSISDEMLSDYTINYGGQLYLMGTMGSLIREDIFGLMRVGIIIMIIIFLVSLRSVPAVLMNLAVIFSSLIVMMGFIGWAYNLTGSDIFLFSLLNSPMPIVLLTIANSYGVHVITKFFKKVRITKNIRESLTITLDSLLLPIFLTSITTITAFLAMVFAPLQQLIGFGIGMSVGIAWAWILASFLLPSLMSLKKWKLDSRAIKSAGIIERFIDKIGRNVMTYPKTILTSALLIVLFATIGIKYLNIEVNLITFFKPGSEIRDSMDFLDNEMTGTMDMELRIEGDIKSPEVLRNIESIQDFLLAHPNVATSISIADIIKAMHKTVMDDDPTFETIPETRQKVNNLFTLYSMSGDPDDFESLVDYDYETALITSFMSSISTSEIAKFVDQTEKFLTDNNLEKLNVTNTGMIVILRDMTGLLIRSSFISIFASVILIALIASVFFKNFRWGLIAVTPLVSAILLNFGLMGWFGLDFSHVTAILSSVIIGVGVDFAIHYISQYKRITEKSEKLSTITSETIDDVGYPIILDAASNMSFGALIFSAFLPIQQIGSLMILAMLATSIGTLTLMASIIELLKKYLITKRSEN